MKYKAGDILEDGEGSIRNIQGSIGDAYFTINGFGSANIYSEKELDGGGFKKKEREIPPDGTPVKVDYTHVRISNGKLDEDGNLLCYEGGRFKGSVVAYDNWELIK